jgi:hypothetical protein
MQELISALFDRWAGKPILVIGGGPSVLTDLRNWPESVEPVAVVSANEHGCRQTRFKVDLLVNVDKTHVVSKHPMENVLRPYGIPIANRHSWPDYRLADWTFSANSGITAVAVAVALGGNPVIVTGIDMWGSGRHYFHDADVISAFDAEKPKHVRLRGGNQEIQTRSAMRRLAALVDFAKGANVRPMSGPMTGIFPRFSPDEDFLLNSPPKDCAYRKKHLHESTIRYTAPHEFNFENRDVVHAGEVLALTRTEAKSRNLHIT